MEAIRKLISILTLLVTLTASGQEFYYLNPPESTQTINITNNIVNVNRPLRTSVNNTQINNFFTLDPLFIQLDFESDLLLFSQNVDFLLQNENNSVDLTRPLNFEVDLEKKKEIWFDPNPTKKRDNGKN